MDTRSHEARDIGAHVVNKPGTVPDAGRRSASLHSSTMLSKSEPKSLLDSRSSETHSSQALQEQTFHSASLHASHGDSLRQDLAHHSARSSSDGRGQDSTRSRSSTHEVHSGNSPSSSNDIFTFGGDTPSRYKRTRHVSSIDKVPSNKRTGVSPESDSSSARRSVPSKKIVIAPDDGRVITHTNTKWAPSFASWVPKVDLNALFGHTTSKQHKEFTQSIKSTSVRKYLYRRKVIIDICSGSNSL